MAEVTIFQMKDRLATVGAQLENVNKELMDKLANPSVPQEEISDLKQQRDHLQERYNLLEEQHNKMVEEQHARLRKQNKIDTATTDKQALIAAKAEFYRAKILGRPVGEKAMEILNQGDPITTLIALPAGETGGENFLPTTLINELVHEPFVRNPLREHIAISAVKGLELPKIGYTIDDDSFITDADTAKELKMTGDKVSFGRFKTKIFASVSDTVIHGSDVNLVSNIENALRSGLAAKERAVSFATESEGSAIDPATVRHMSLYATNAGTPDWNTLIAGVEGADLFEAITNAYATLHEDFRANAKCCMRKVDWVTMLKTLSNNAVSLYGAQPEDIIGFPVFFSDSATVPIVGDFRYLHLNYDPQVVFDTDKDIKQGEYLWAMTAWFDQHVLLRSAFRLAVVPENGEDGEAE